MPGWSLRLSQKYNLCSAQHKSIGGAHKGKAGHNHLIAGPNATQDRSHFKGVGAARSQQTFPKTITILKKGMALLGK